MGTLTGTKCFSILVASGRGQECGALRAAIRQATLRRGPEGEVDAVIWKNRAANPAAWRRVARGLLPVVLPFLFGVPPHVFGPDGGNWAPRNVN